MRGGGWLVGLLVENSLPHTTPPNYKTTQTQNQNKKVYDLLNALEDRLGHVNSAVVVAALKVFLHLTLDMPATHQQVLERLREPLKSLISRDDAATAYAALCHARLLVARAPFVFENDFVAFYCRTHDPWCVLSFLGGRGVVWVACELE